MTKLIRLFLLLAVFARAAVGCSGGEATPEPEIAAGEETPEEFTSVP